MERLSEKFKKSQSFKSDDNGYFIFRQGEQRGRRHDRGKTAKIEISRNLMISDHFIPGSSIQLKRKQKNRFFTVIESGKLEKQVRKGIENSGFNVPLDFSVSLKINSKPLVLDFPLKTCATDDERNLMIGDFSLKSINEINETIKHQENKNPIKDKNKKTNRTSKKSSKNSRKHTNLHENHEKSKQESFSKEQSILNLKIIDSDEEKSVNNPESPQRSPLLSNQKTFSQFHFYSFSEALSKFNSLPTELVQANLWLSTKLEKICHCFSKPVKLTNDFQDLCEKFIIFAYSGFDSNNSFHSDLASTVFKKMEKINDEETGLILSGFSSEDPFEKDLNHDMASVGLLFLLFLCDSIHVTLSKMVKYCVSLDIAFVGIAFDVAHLVVLALRKKVLNRVMVKAQKCLETLFFFYTGCLSQWFVLHKEMMGDIRRTFEQLEKQVMKYPIELIELAWTVIQAQG
jgi:hypothetical protein